MISRILAVAWRDFKHTVLKKSFLLGILGIPLALVAIIALTVVIMEGHEEPPLVGTLAIVDGGGDLVEEARRALDRAGKPEARLEALQEQTQSMIEQAQSGTMPAPSDMMPGGLLRGEVRLAVERVEPAPDNTDALRRRVLEGDLIAAAIPSEDVLLSTWPGESNPGFTLLVGHDLDKDHTSLIERSVGRAIVNARIARTGRSAEETRAMMRPPRAETRRILANGEDASESSNLREMKQLVPAAFMMLIWISTFTAGQHLLMSTIEEKSNRVMEVLLSAVSPLQLMTGKILGQGGVGLVIVLIYSSLSIGGLLVFALLHLIEMVDLAFLAIYFLMAYFMIASLMAAVGSAVSDIREANTLMMPVMLVMMVPLVLWLPISESPNGAVATACSFVPPAIPFAMILRIAADEPLPVWQIPVSIAWGGACTLGMIWMAAKIFRVGVLMYGKPPTPVQLVRWLRYA